MPRRLIRDDARFEADFAALLADRAAIAGDVAERVAAIIAEVRQRGDDALVAFTRRFDRLRLEPRAFAVTAAERDAAAERCAPDTLAALNLAAGRISDHHRRQRPDDLDYRDAAGVRLGHRWRPVSAAGLYVPGGTAAYPSSVLMTALPAKVAGVERLAMAVPAPDGVLDPLVLAAAKIATQGGCHLASADGRIEHPLRALIEGGRCTWFLAEVEPRTARKRWIAGSMSPSGRIAVDAGALGALRRGKSLLPAGVTLVEGGFERGDAVSVADPGGAEVARGLIAYSAADARRIMGHRSGEIETLLGYRGREEMIHRDDLVLL